MTTNRFDVAGVLRKAAGVLLISSGAALAQNADSARVVSPQLALAAPQSGVATPIPDCPQIPKVCALIADPAVRNYIGPAEYAWDFNATDGAPGPTLQSDRRVAGLGRN
ncbi:hypothetical protein [Bradyrhizobium sp.]|uniref:hypothetical protein n=1 Tax=Bradyrhizobium sp. TaxID=376 RepID=UPI003C775432